MCRAPGSGSASECRVLAGDASLTGVWPCTSPRRCRGGEPGSGSTSFRISPGFGGVGVQSPLTGKPLLGAKRETWHPKATARGDPSGPFAGTVTNFSPLLIRPIETFACAGRPFRKAFTGSYLHATFEVFKDHFCLVTQMPRCHAEASAITVCKSGEVQTLSQVMWLDRDQVWMITQPSSSPAQPAQVPREYTQTQGRAPRLNLFLPRCRAGRDGSKRPATPGW